MWIFMTLTTRSKIQNILPAKEAKLVAGGTVITISHNKTTNFIHISSGVY